MQECLLYAIRSWAIIRLGTAVALVTALLLAASIASAEPAAGVSQGPYAAIDERVLRTPASAETSLDELAKYLAGGAKSDLEKTRAIFRWITANIVYDTSLLSSSVEPTADADEILKHRRTVCMGYSEIFYTLAKKAGLEVERIAGFAKGYNSGSGKPCNSSPNHEWNAVRIGGRWMLIDCTWGAGYIEQGPKFVKRYEEYYFDPPPEQFIFDHYPLDPDWQLLPKPVSCDEYLKSVSLKPAFFKCGLALESHRRQDVKATGPVEISLTARRDLVMMAQLLRGREQIPRSYTFIEKDSARLKVTAAFPSPGTYTLRLFAKPEGAPGNCEWVADYRIEVASLREPCQCFPESLTAFMELDARLVSPRTGKLESGSKQQFSLAVPGAKVVAVIAGKKWSYLEKVGDVFQGTVEITSEPMQVCANFGNPREYQVLLTYNQPQVGVAGSQQETGTPPKP